MRNCLVQVVSDSDLIKVTFTQLQTCLDLGFYSSYGVKNIMFCILLRPSSNKLFTMDAMWCAVCGATKCFLQNFTCTILLRAQWLRGHYTVTRQLCSVSRLWCCWYSVLCASPCPKSPLCNAESLCAAEVCPLPVSGVVLHGDGDVCNQSSRLVPSSS